MTTERAGGVTDGVTDGVTGGATGSATGGAAARALPLGTLALLSAATGVASGVLLAFHYAPTLEAAQASLAHLERDVALGAFLRALHHWCGNLALVLALLHAARAIWRGDFRRDPKRLWPLACGTGVVLLLLGWTGYLLAGDARALTGIEVAQGVARGTPAIGPAAARVLLGGVEVSSATLVRLYAAHVFVLPALLALLVALLARALGPEERRAAGRRAMPWSPALAGALVAGAVFLPPRLGPPADLLAGSAPDARPEWFFLWINELLRVLGGNPFWAGAALPAAVLVGVVALPWWARRRHALLERAALAVGTVALLALSVSALPAKPAGEPEEPAATGGAPTGAEAFDREVAAIRERFGCADCHTIDGDPGGGDTGPPLDRDGFGALYTRKYFRDKVSDPVAFWKHTGMIYVPRRLKPTREQVTLLERWFFGDGPPSGD